MKDNTEIQKTFAVTGLRREKLNWDNSLYQENEKQLISKITDIIVPYIEEKGITNFITGMASGADLMFAKAIINIKQQYKDIVLQGVLPYKNYENYVNKNDLYDYRLILTKLDILRILQTNYSKNCFSKRNKFIVDNSTVLLAITNEIDKFRSGTSQTINFAIKSEKEVIVLNHNNFGSLYTKIIK